MLSFTEGIYTIKVFDESEVFTDFLDRYANIYIESQGYKPTSLVGIDVYQDDLLLKKIILGAVGGGTSVHKSSVILDNNKLVCCCCDSVFCVAIPNLNLLWKTKADMATCFQIFKYQRDYIVHGELEITRLGEDGNIIWQQGGADIFTTLDGRDEFIITDEYILATDWEHRKYKFDFDGNIISD